MKNTISFFIQCKIRGKIESSVNRSSQQSVTKTKILLDSTIYESSKLRNSIDRLDLDKKGHCWQKNIDDCRLFVELASSSI